MSQQTPNQPAAAPADPATAGSRRALLVTLGVIVLLAVGLAAILTHGFHTKSGEAKDACEENISGQLKSPSTAKYSGEIVTETSGSYRVTGNVDAQNGFGATLRSSFSCTLRSVNGEWVADQAWMS